MIGILQVVTPVHVGEGAAVGAVNLPVARERHTGWPVVPGSAIKGALRDRAARLGHPAAEVAAVFGSEPGEDPARGTVSFGDAVLLALAVRSLQGTFALLTSPLALGRLARWLPDPPTVPEVGIERAACAEPGRLRVPELDRVVLEDLPMLLDPADLRHWADRIRGLAAEDTPVEHLALVHDDVLGLAARCWLPIRTRAAIGEDGVVKRGALFTAEALPPETLLVTTLRGAPPPGTVLPGAGEVFALGRHRTIGCGRAAWYGRF